MNADVSYIIGLWKADKCSTAKGIVGIRSKDDEIIDRFTLFLLKHFPEQKLRTRTVLGYGLTKEVYVCSYPTRKLFEKTIPERNNMDEKFLASFFAGIIDGDGSIDPKSRMTYIAYGLKDRKEIELDKKLLNKLGFSSSINRSGRALKLNIHKPKNFLKLIFPYMMLKCKREKISAYLDRKPNERDPCL